MEQLRQVAVPQVPTAVEKIEHLLTHFPTATWCSHCVRGKGHDDPHRRQDYAEEDLHPQLVEMDFGHLRTEQSAEATWPMLCAVHPASGSGMAQLCEKKGPDDRCVLKALEEWLNEIGLIGVVRLRTDNEPAILALAKLLAASRLARTHLETAPVKSLL